MRLSLLLICLLILPTYAFPASITIGSALNRPPYIIEDAESGLEIDIVNAAFKEMGQSVNFKFYSRKRQVLYFNKDRLDAVMTMNPANGVDGYWSNDYVDYTNVAISLAAQHLEIKSIADLKNYSIAAFENARLLLGAEFNAVAQQTIYREVDTQLSQNRMLYLGRINTNIDTQQALSYHFIFPPTSYRMVFHNSVARDTFNQGLAKIKANGIYQTLVVKYLGSA